MRSSLRNTIAFYTICSTVAIGIIGIAFKAREASRAMSFEENLAVSPKAVVSCTPEARAEDEEIFFVSCGGFY